MLIQIKVRYSQLAPLLLQSGLLPAECLSILYRAASFAMFRKVIAQII
jgi:hypothetical protein